MDNHYASSFHNYIIWLNQIQVVYNHQYTHQKAVNLISGIVVIFFGLNFLGIFNLNLFKGNRPSFKMNNMNFFSLMLFGIIFSLGWTPCVGAFLGSALMLASTQGQTGLGMLMLLCYSLGLGIPFILSAILIQRLKTAFHFIKKNYRIINCLSGCFLILVAGIAFLILSIIQRIYRKSSDGMEYLCVFCFVSFIYYFI